MKLVFYDRSLHVACKYLVRWDGEAFVKECFQSNLETVVLMTLFLEQIQQSLHLHTEVKYLSKFSHGHGVDNYPSEL